MVKEGTLGIIQHCRDPVHVGAMCSGALQDAIDGVYSTMGRVGILSLPVYIATCVPADGFRWLFAKGRLSPVAGYLICPLYTLLTMTDRWALAVSPFLVARAAPCAGKVLRVLACFAPYRRCLSGWAHFEGRACKALLAAMAGPVASL